MLTVILVRHGEVLNPNHVVYGDLPGFDLSRNGVLQVHATARHLHERGIDLVVSSPLARARHSASAIARGHGLDVMVDERLTEARMFPSWTGMLWDDVERQFPDQYHGYLSDATVVEGVAESVFDIARRVTGVISDARDAGHTTIVVVGHQDPTQILRLALTARPLSGLRQDPPAHASATSLVSSDGARWVEASVWDPEIGEL